MKGKYGKYNYEYVKIFIEKDGNTLLSEEYINCKEKLSIKCKCGEIYSTDFTTYIGKNKNRCDLCSKGTHKLRESILKNIKSQNATLVTKIENIYSESDIHIKCRCGNDIMTKTKYIKKKINIICKDCIEGIQLKSNSDFLKIVENKVGDEYTFLEDYNGAHTKIKVRHNICGYEYFVTPDKFTNANRRCPHCKISKGEYKISKFLNENNIPYKIQYKINECKFKKPLPFDFAIFDKYNNLKYLIEYDGEYHYNDSRVYQYFRNEEDFEITKLRDTIKTEYCKNNSINLIRIPYTEFDKIEEILKTSLII